MPDIEDEIRRATESGLFDNLPGKGQPLRLDDNPFEDPDWRLAYRALKNAGYSLPWIEQRREILAQQDLIRARLGVAWQKHQTSDNPETDIAWQHAVDRFQVDVGELNARIRAYNLHAPGLQFQLKPLNAQRELELTTRPPSDTLPQQ